MQETTAMKHPWLIVIAGVSLAGAAMASEMVVNFSGTWVLDPAHSELVNKRADIRKLDVTTNRGYSVGGNEGSSRPEELSMHPAEILTLSILQTDSEMQTMRQFTTEGQAQAVAQKFALDGSQCLNVASDGMGEFVSRTNWKNGKLIISGTQTITQGGQSIEISVTEEYSISKDGKKLTIKTTSITGEGITTLKQAFNKH
jgi:hypothetical protein